jgi:serine protease Do
MTFSFSLEFCVLVTKYKTPIRKSELFLKPFSLSISFQNCYWNRGVDLMTCVKWFMSLVLSVVFLNFAQAQGLPDFTDLIEKHSPAVVKIIAISHVNQRQFHNFPQGMQQQVPEIFREYLERRQMPREQGSQGTGFIIEANGYILTNDHVIDGAASIKVVLNDQREFDAKLMGRDARSDLALLKIDAKDLPILTLAKNTDVKVGQWVVAIGSPYGLDYSATAGIVSALERSIPSAHSRSSYIPFIQTDVAINPGNSGGPLFNLAGEVVGINTQLVSPTGSSVGLSLAIPSALALDVVSQLKEKGRVDRGWLGVYLQEVDKGLANSLGLDKPVGALVNDVTPSGPADQAGIQAGDVIIRYKDHAVNHSSDLPHLVGRTRPNTKVPVVIMRKGKEQTLQVKVGNLPGTNELAGQPTRQDAGGKDPLGLDLVAYQAEGRDQPEAGVQVRNLKPDSPAAKAGLNPGDVITQLAFSEVKTLADYQKVVKGLKKGETYAVRFYREGRPVFRSIIIGD